MSEEISERHAFSICLKQLHLFFWVYNRTPIEKENLIDTRTVSQAQLSNNIWERYPIGQYETVTKSLSHC